MKNPIRGIPLVILLTALLMASCGTVKKSVSEETFSKRQNNQNEQVEAEAVAVQDINRHAQKQAEMDSTTTRREYAEPVPEQRTDMTIPTQSLLNLPDGAKYTAQNGRASVEAERQGDKIIVRGKCDSIARRCTYFENRVFRQRLLIDSLTTRLSAMQVYYARADSHFAAELLTRQMATRTDKPPATWYWWLFAGFLAGGAVSALLTKTNPLKTIFSLIKKVV